MLKEEQWKVGAIILCFFVLITVPFLIANYLADQDHVFAGFLANPIDGNSYLAKMRQGYEGNWFFTLPYTADPGEGAALNLYYLLLGHMAAVLGLSLLLVLHLARVAGSLLLAISLYHFFRKLFQDRGVRLFAFALALFGSGLGWLALWFGFASSDFWVAEAFPFLASFTNAHFPLGLALQLWLIGFALTDGVASRRTLALAFSAALLLSIIYPFGWLVAVAVMAADLLWKWKAHSLSRSDLVRWLLIAAGGAPVSLYSLWVANAHPALAQWNAQNLTPAPALLDLIISLSPVLLIAVLSLYMNRRVKDSRIQPLLIWLIFGLVLVYAPFNLQRRLISGIFVPVAGLATYAISAAKWSPAFKRWTAIGLLILALPTNVFIGLGSLGAVRGQEPLFVIAKSELAAFEWLNGYAAPQALVLASPDSGLLLPAYANIRVIYGHPFETIQADKRQQETNSFFSGSWGDNERMTYMDQMGVDYVFYGPREQALGADLQIPGWLLVYDQDGVQIWKPGVAQ